MVVDHAVGIALALAAAIGSAATSLFVRRGTENGTVTDAVLVTSSVNLLVLLPVGVAWYVPHYGLTPTSWLSFAAAGIVGTVLGRILKYTSITKIGASRTEPVVAAWVLVSAVLGAVFLDESMTVVHGVGIVLVVTGVGLITWETSHENPEKLSRRALLFGVTIPLGAAVALGLEPIFASFGLETGTPALIGLVLKTAAAVLGLTLYLRLTTSLPTREALFSSSSRWFVLAGVCSTLALLSYYVAIGIAPVNVVVPVIATNTLFVVLFSTVFMSDRLEQITWRIVAAACVVLVGVVTVSIVG